ncbi:bifunctional riboflavin kinase/FAD synthetase [Caulobacter sp. 17J65-9]|uniref:bifunctional riboflavin kinase/FAD synthetase n=1 Tax=Caulobacter sp. 17J65-9 TaxID=2709382 RepID=UPI0013CA1E34|nr:bifunctional riboflavin kinase/FAD synthetase [Caulobacter sp. 17J65-9]NEX93590.1 bifunctional riboflavin kinase/FAD synthetase [Caulobacter sp. 17J65-9]
MSLTVVKGWRDLPPELKGASIALGNFDGVHRGHRRVIADAAQAAARLKAPLGVISFDPHPRRLFQPAAEPFLVMNLDQQARALEALGVDLFYVLPFDAEMAAMSDHAFAEQVLAEGLGARHVAVGFDVTYGKGRTGSPESLTEDGRRLGFTVSVAERAADDRDVKYSSSAVRDALKAGRPEEAGEILGRPFAIEGEVAHGDKRGRTIGFPTLNLALDDYVRPAFGVYATRTRLADGREVPGVSNLGRRPTVNGADERLETHLFDFDEDLYGQTVETALIAFLRPEQKFESFDALKVQIAEDAKAARDLLLPPL